MNSVIFVRHGQSLGNADHAYYHLPDVANILTQKGVDQCVDLNKTIRSLLENDFYGTHTTVIASKYQRAQLTAQIVMAGMVDKANILVDARLNETVHKAENEPIEPRNFVIRRIRSLVEQYPFNLVLFTHGMVMGTIDPLRGNAKNCEARKYDRDDLLANYLK